MGHGFCIGCHRSKKKKSKPSIVQYYSLSSAQSLALAPSSPPELAQTFIALLFFQIYRNNFMKKLAPHRTAGFLALHQAIPFYCWYNTTTPATATNLRRSAPCFRSRKLALKKIGEFEGHSAHINPPPPPSNRRQQFQLPDIECAFGRNPVLDPLKATRSIYIIRPRRLWLLAPIIGSRGIVSFPRCMGWYLWRGGSRAKKRKILSPIKRCPLPTPADNRSGNAREKNSSSVLPPI